jgi:hypothetical protein
LIQTAIDAGGIQFAEFGRMCVLKRKTSSHMWSRSANDGKAIIWMRIPAIKRRRSSSI